MVAVGRDTVAHPQGRRILEIGVDAAADGGGARTGGVGLQRSTGHPWRTRHRDRALPSVAEPARVALVAGWHVAIDLDDPQRIFTNRQAHDLARRHRRARAAVQQSEIARPG